MQLAANMDILAEFLDVLDLCGYDVRQVWAESQRRVNEWKAISTALRDPEVETDGRKDMRRRRIFSLVEHHVV